MEISQVIAKLAARSSKHFTYHGQALSYEQVAAADGALPILAKRASLLHDFLFGKKLEISFTSNPAALTSETLKIDDRQQLFVLVMLLYDILEEFVVKSGDEDTIDLKV